MKKFTIIVMAVLTATCALTGCTDGKAQSQLTSTLAASAEESKENSQIWVDCASNDICNILQGKKGSFDWEFDAEAELSKEDMELLTAEGLEFEVKRWDKSYASGKEPQTHIELKLQYDENFSAECGERKITMQCGKFSRTLDCNVINAGDNQVCSIMKADEIGKYCYRHMGFQASLAGNVLELDDKRQTFCNAPESNFLINFTGDYNPAENLKIVYEGKEVAYKFEEAIVECASDLPHTALWVEIL